MKLVELSQFLKRNRGMMLTDNEELLEIAEEYLPLANTASISADIYNGCLVLLIEEEGACPFFIYPIPKEDANVSAAVRAIGEYCRSRNLIEKYTDVPLLQLPVLLRGVKHARISAASEDSYTVSIQTECMLCDELPKISTERLTLCELDMRYADDYARLILDGEVNRYCGEDCRRQMSLSDAEFFVREAHAEFEDGFSMTFAAVLKDDSSFIGEGVLYNFDGRGGAELAFRLHKTYWGNGYGKELLKALIVAASSVGLSTLYAYAYTENLRSIDVLSKHMKMYYKDAEKACFKANIS